MCHKSSDRQYVKEGLYKCFNKTLFIKSGSGLICPPGQSVPILAIVYQAALRLSCVWRGMLGKELTTDIFVVKFHKLHVHISLN